MTHRQPDERTRMSRWTCIARKPLVVVACALSLFASVQVFALAPAGAEALPVVSSYDVRPAAVGEHCMSGSAIDGNTSRQCNDAWNLVNAYVGGVGSFGQDCDVTFL